MTTQELSNFINLYNLNDTVEAIRWKSTATSTELVFATQSRTLAGTIKHAGFCISPDTEIGIANTKRLKRMISVFSKDSPLNFSLITHNTKNVALAMSDSKLDVSYVLCELSILPSPPKFKIPPIEVEAPLSKEFCDKFIKIKDALGDDATTVTIQQTKANALNFVVGHRKTANANKINISVQPTVGAGGLTTDLTFNAMYLRDILSATAWMNQPTVTMKLANIGFASLAFTDGKNVTADYYLVQEKLT